MKRYKYAIVIICVVVVIIGITTIILYNIKSSNTKKGEEIISNSTNLNIVLSDEYSGNVSDIVSTSSNNIEKISPNAIIIFNKYYKDCGHTVKTREDVKEELVNCTKEELEKIYSDWNVLRFSKSEVELYKEFDEECDEHYLVKDDEGVISIYKIDENNNLEKIQDTEISTQYLSEIDLISLKEGVSLVGKEELNAYIENFE